MARIVFTLILTFLLNPGAHATLEKSFTEGYLGEKTPTGPYYGPWRPQFHHDPYFGRTTWDDEAFFSGQLYPYVWSEAPEWGKFFSEELMGASTCPHPELSRYFDEMRYAHRLLAMSYLLEVMDSARADMDLLRQDKVCRFDLQALLKQCRPKSDDMSTFLNNLSAQAPYTAPVIDKTHNFSKYEREWLSGTTKIEGSLAAMRTGLQCKLEKRVCSSSSLGEGINVMERACAADRELFLSICSEDDQIYGVSTAPLATYLLGTSNLVTLFNVEGHAQGCLRRFGQMMANKEHQYPVQSALLPLIHSSLKSRFGARYPHGRAFVYGALKEFQQKGLTNIFEPKVEKPLEPVAVVTPVEPVVESKKEAPVAAVVATAKPVEKVKIPEVPIEVKSAFLQAAEVRAGQDLERVDVDMLKFSYDHVFTPTEMKLLGSSLKLFTERKALEEMKQYDKLGTKEGPVPLTFLKFLIDDQNHQGLFNLTAVLKEKFWITNDIDAKFKPAPEFAELRNDESTGNTWQLYILRAEE